jgi:hypothetical protein
MTIGNVGKASYAEFAGKRKLLIIPYVTPTRNHADLLSMVETYWKDAIGQVTKLEIGLGDVRHLFHEGSVGEADDAMDILQQGNPLGYQHLRTMIDGGATLEPTEDVEALKETLDLHRCITAVQVSRPVLERLLEWFEESRNRRYAAIAKRVNEHLAKNAVGVLVISPDHEVSFADDIEVVYVVPPVLDRINTWMRDNPLEPVVDVDETPVQPPDIDDGTPGWAIQ